MDLLSGLNLKDLLDIGVVAVLLYAVLVWFKQTKAVFVAAGMFILVGVYILARELGLTMTSWLLQGFFAIFLIMSVIIFQEELRSFFERIAVWSLGRGRRYSLREPEVDLLVRTLGDLAAAKTGALLVLKGQDPLDRHLQAGWELGGALSEPLLKSLFDPHSPGHDGAVIIEEDRVARFGCQLPLSKDYQKIQGLGTRHTAALGISELTDALCLVVSEERGTISAARHGTLSPVPGLDRLSRLVSDFLAERRPTPRVAWPIALFTKNPREKALAILCSVALWFVFVRGTEVETRRFLLPVRLFDVPADVRVTALQPALVHATVAGLRRDMRRANADNMYVSVDLLGAMPGAREYVLSPRNFHLPSDLSVVEADPLVSVTLGQRPAPGGAAGGELPAISSGEAETLVRNLPEVRERMARAEAAGGSGVVRLDSVPNLDTQTPERQVYGVYYAEDRDGRLERQMTFEVNARTKEISVFDETQDAFVPLAQWRKSRSP